MSAFCFLREKKIAELLEERQGKENFRPYLESLGLHLQKIKPDLQKMTIITVGGTNGKGGTCKEITKHLFLAKKKVALWTSPHLLSVRERFSFGNQYISYDELEFLIHQNIPECKDLSYFEFLFFIFCQFARDKKADYLVLEVGLGGLFDAVNVLDADIAVLTSISRDHTEILGKTFFQILLQKLGITRPHKKLITAFESDYLNQKVLQYTKERQIDWTSLRDTLTLNYFQKNQALAKLTMREIGLEVESPKDYSPHGYDQIKRIGEANFFLWGAHNLDGVRKTVLNLPRKFNNAKIDGFILCFSQRETKEVISMIKNIREFFPESLVSLCDWDHYKALEKSKLENIAQNLGICIENDWKNIINSKKQGNWIVGCSIYLAGEFYKEYQFDNPHFLSTY